MLNVVGWKLLLDHVMLLDVEPSILELVAGSLFCHRCFFCLNKCYIIYYIIIINYNTFSNYLKI